MFIDLGLPVTRSSNVTRANGNRKISNILSLGQLGYMEGGIQGCIKKHLFYCVKVR